MILLYLSDSIKREMLRSTLLRRGVFLSLSFLVGCSSVCGITQLGSGELFFEGRAEVGYDSNLFIQESNTQDDFRSVFFGGVGFTQENKSLIDANLSIGREYSRFFDFSEQDSEDWRSSFSISYPNNIESAGYSEFSGGWNERSQANAAVGRRIQVETLDLNGQHRHQITDKVGGSFSVSFQNQKYNNINGSASDMSIGEQSEIVNLSITPSYRYSDKLTGNLLVQYRDLSYESRSSENQSGNTFAFGLSGQLLPKVSGSVFFGVQKSDFDRVVNSSNSSDPFYSVNLAWAARDKTTVTVIGSSNFQASAIGQVNERKDLNLRVRERLSSRTSLSAGVSYSKDSYRGAVDRDDESVILDADYTFNITDSTSLSMRGSYEDSSSSVSGFGFEQVFVSVGISNIW